MQRLTAGGNGRHWCRMPARARLFPWLRRSVLGAWFATAYALSVLALALAPAPSLAAGLPAGILLCSGAPAPADDGAGVPAAPLGELGHCKGCPHNPVLAAPPAPATVAAARNVGFVAPPSPRPEAAVPLVATGLPPSRAPPGA